MIRRSIAWQNGHVPIPGSVKLIRRAEITKTAKVA
jgi:hypothetical protein